MLCARGNVKAASGRAPGIHSEARPGMIPSSAQRQSLPSALRLPWLWGHHSLFLLSAQATLLEWQVGGNPSRPWNRFWRGKRMGK